MLFCVDGDGLPYTRGRPCSTFKHQVPLTPTAATHSRRRHGVTLLAPGIPSYDPPPPAGGGAGGPGTGPAPVKPDNWAFFAFVVGCSNVSWSLQLKSPSTQAAAPMMVVRREQLPLMVQGTHEYFDYYRQIQH